MFRIPYTKRTGLWYDVTSGTFNPEGTLFLNIVDAWALAKSLQEYGLAAGIPEEVVV